MSVIRIEFIAVGSRWMAQKLEEWKFGAAGPVTTLRGPMSPQEALALATEVLLAGAKPDGGSRTVEVSATGKWTNPDGTPVKFHPARDAS